LVQAKLSLLVTKFEQKQGVAFHKDQFFRGYVVDGSIVSRPVQFGSIDVDANDCFDRGVFRKGNGIATASAKGVQDRQSSAGQLTHVHRARRHVMGDAFGSDRKPAFLVERYALIESRKETMSLIPILSQLWIITTGIRRWKGS
jgi:hypothetical protein